MCRLLVLSLLVAGSAASQIIAIHDYDPVTDAVVSWRIEPGRRAGQKIQLRAAAKVGGFEAKLQRSGPPADLRFRLGVTPGGAEIASGSLPAAGIGPWFERWHGARFRPKQVAAGHVYLELSLPEGSGGSYEWFGTSAERLAVPEFQIRFGYRENWYPRAEAAGAFESAPNLDYGAATPRYEGGTAYDQARREVRPLDLAFQLSGEKTPPVECEERFAFIEEMTGPLDRRPIRDHAARRRSTEVVLSGAVRAAPGAMLDIAAREMREFLASNLGLRTGEMGAAIYAAAGCGAPERRSEAFHIKAASDRIEICGYDERGAMRGLHHVEALLRLRRAPYLEAGEIRLAPVHSPRITSAPFYSKSELDSPVDPYSDGLLARISRAGFNAIWVWGDLDEVAHSDVYPELDHGAGRRQARLRDLITRCRRYGIDVHLYLASRPLPEEFYARHPEVRGSALPAYGGVNILCSGVPRVQDHLRAAARNLMASVPGLTGFSFIAGGEGFMHCYTRKNTCPRCSLRSPQETIAELSTALFEGARTGNPRAQVALWPYSASNTWSKDDTTQSRLIERLPRGMILMTEFAKEGAITFGGITIPAYDYPISIAGPSERFVRQADSARQHGLGFWAKAEHAIALEFVQTPYIPVFFQWAERFRRIREAPGVTAVFANWMHYGFTPSLAADIFYWNLWDPSQDAETALGRLAARDFGDVAAPFAVRAWRLFSEAIREYPFSGAMAMGVLQTGPAHPLFFDPDYRPAHGAGRQFKNDLTWTRPWGPALAIAQLEKMHTRWAAGVEQLEQARSQTPAELRRNVDRELGIARALAACMRSAGNIARFYSLREQLSGTGEATARKHLFRQMEQVARSELDNARSALPVVCADSRIGYANSGRNEQTGVARGGIWSAAAVRKKIAQVERMLELDLVPQTGLPLTR